VTCTAELESISGRFFVYKVEATLASGMKLGWGHIDRAVVNVSSFMTKA